MKLATTITVIFLVIVAIVHFLRIIFQWKVTVNTIDVPISASIFAGLACAALAIWVWQENKKKA
jgi:hypothetical protein